MLLEKSATKFECPSHSVVLSCFVPSQEEAVPAALQSRPNKITKAALVDQAFGLQTHVIDTAAHHARVFPPKNQTFRGTALNPLQSIAAAFENKGYIWKHQAAIRKAKGSDDRVEPPKKLMHILRSHFLHRDSPSNSEENSVDDERFQDLKSFVEEHCMMEHVPSKETRTSHNRSKEQNPLAACENMVLNLTKLIDTEDDGEVISALWITILSMLSVEHPSTDSHKSKDHSSAVEETSAEADCGEVPPFSFLQIGALLPLCKVPTEANDNELLQYFSEAATAYQERLEIQEARRIVADSKNGAGDTEQPPEAENMNDLMNTTAFERTEHIDGNTPTSDESPHMSTAGTIAIEPGELAAAGVHDDRYDQSDTEPANRSHPSSDASSSESSGEGSSSSSSESSDENNEPDNPHVEIPEAAAFVESGQDPRPNDADEAVLRGALGIRLGRGGSQAEAVRVILADSVVPAIDNLEAFQPETPVSEDTSSRLGNALHDDDDPLDDPVENEEEEMSLPRLPPVVAYPWRQTGLHDNQNDPDALTRNLLPQMDPSNSENFSKVPTSYALVYLLKFAEVLVQRESSARKVAEKEFLTAPGGTAHDLFSSKNSTSRDTMTDLSAENDPAIFQLIIACLLTIDFQRKEAVDNLNKAIHHENGVSPKTNNEINSPDAATADESSAGEETDDPALTFAMNYVEDDTPLSIESLENKGMKRKAAAAAHDAESLRKCLQKRTEAWKVKVALYTKLLVSTMKCLASFLQVVTRRWLRKIEGGKRSLSFSKSVSEYREYLSGKTLNSLRYAFDCIIVAKLDVVVLDALQEELRETSIAAWSECFPLLFPSARDMLPLLNTLTQQGAQEPIDANMRPTMWKYLSERMRVIDTLGILLPSPSTFVMDSEAISSQTIHSYDFEAVENRNNDWMKEVDGFPNVKALMMSLYDVSRTGNNHSLTSLFYALCHRMNTVALLFDGLYAVTETEAEKTSHFASQGSKAGQSTNAVLSKVPSNSFVFDSTKCSDSIAIQTGFDSSGANGSSILQRASKVWGTVLASKHFSPKTGTHRWAIRLDKCERGHVFIGVAASRANTRTYVGGDKYGWGMIGTQALWHDRRKIRGDYGAPFRTGSTVIVTLDTNLGTLSLGTWKDPVSTADPVVQNLLSPKRRGQCSGTIDEWGIAFEGLPLDAKLFPAVGLYQRDDRVTLLSVQNENVDGGSAEAIGGKSFFPPLYRTMTGSQKEAVLCTRSNNDLLNWGGIEYSASVLERCSLIGSEELDSNWKGVLLSLLSSLCLLPASIPLLSQRAALTLLPHIDRCMKNLKDFKSRAVLNLVEGDWVIRATSGDGDLEEYVVKFEQMKGNGFKGTGVGTTGKSKNGIVSISGFVNGYTVSFLEEWADDVEKGLASKEDSSSCIIHGTIALDGTKFEGKYMNMEYGTTGSVGGMCKVSDPEAQNFAGFQMVQTLLCLAHSHLVSIVSHDVSKDGLLLLESNSFLLGSDNSTPSNEKLSDVLKKSFLSTSCLLSASEWSNGYLYDLCSLYSPPTKSLLCGLDPNLLLKNTMGLISEDLTVEEDDRPLHELHQVITSVDEKLIETTRTRGSLSPLDPERYGNTRRKVIASLTYHSRLEPNLISEHDDGTPVSEDILRLWQVAGVIMEDGIRRAISRSDRSRKEALIEQCSVVDSVSSFLLDLRIDADATIGSPLEDIRELYSLIDGADSIHFLRRKMMLATSSSIMHLIALKTTSDFISSNSSIFSDGIESVALGLCELLAQLSRNTNSLVHSKTFRNSLPGDDGAQISVRRTLRRKINEAFLFFLEQCSISLARRTNSQSRMNDVDSLVLASLAIFMMCLDLGGTKSVARFLTLMKNLLSIYRPLFMDTAGIQRGSDDPIGIVQLLSNRDLSYAISRCTTATVHVCYYLLAEGWDVSKKDSTEFLATWFRSELGSCFETLEGHFGKMASSQVEQCSNDEWARFIKNGDTKKDEKRGKDRRRKRKGGLLALSELGTIHHLDFKNGFRTIKNKGENHSDAPVHRHLSHWLHILCVVLRRDSTFKEALLSDSATASLLLSALGIHNERGASDGSISNVELRQRKQGILPARYRARIAFFLRHVLPKMLPNTEIAGGLFSLSASHLLVTGNDGEELLVAQETISLLRNLYDPDLQGWMHCLNDVIADCMAGGSLLRKLGLQVFLSGTMGEVNLFSFVLLKPALSPPGGQESFLNSSGKHSSSSAHSIVPVGSEAVLSGLLRSTAEGGIVSSIDEKTGICEVILSKRSQNEMNDGVDASLSSSSSSSSGPTVRALRTPMSEIITCQEVPLYFDGAIFPSAVFCQTLERALDSLLSGSASGSISQKVIRVEEQSKSEIFKAESIQISTEMKNVDALPLEGNDCQGSALLDQSQARNVCYGLKLLTHTHGTIIIFVCKVKEEPCPCYDH